MDIALLFTLRVGLQSGAGMEDRNLCTANNFPQKVFRLLEIRGDLDYRRREPFSNWQDWAFHEAAVRTALIYFILMMVVCMDDGIRCNQPGDWLLDDLPLPGPKVTWHAPDEIAWMKASSACRYEEMATLTFGDLAKEHVTPEREELVNMWQEGVDEFGLIVAMACRLPRPVHLLLE